MGFNGSLLTWSMLKEQGPEMYQFPLKKHDEGNS